MDVCRAALSICPWMDGSRAMQEQLPRMRMAACPPKSIHFQVADRPHDGAAFFLVTSFWANNRSVSRTYSLSNNEARKDVECETQIN